MLDKKPEPDFMTKKTEIVILIVKMIRFQRTIPKKVHPSVICGTIYPRRSCPTFKVYFSYKKTYSNQTNNVAWNNTLYTYIKIMVIVLFIFIAQL